MRIGDVERVSLASILNPNLEPNLNGELHMIQRAIMVL